MTARLPWYKRNPKDFIVGCIGLDNEHYGVYSRLCDLMFYRWEPLADAPAELARICGMSTRRFNIVLGALVDRHKKLLRLPDGRLSNERFQRELSKIEGKKPGKNQDKTEIISTGLFDSNDLAPGESKNLESTLPDSHANGPKRPIPGGEHWTLTPTERAYAESKGFDPNAVTAMSEAFRDHHLKTGNRWNHWTAAWQTWVRNQIKFNAERQNRNGGSNGTYRSQQPQRGGGFSAIGARLREATGVDAGSSAAGVPPDRRH